MNYFLNISQTVGQKPYHVQGPGGNTSVKIGDRMFVKASGYNLKELEKQYGYVSCRYENIATEILSVEAKADNPDTYLNTVIDSYTISNESFGTPSIETGMHAVLPSRYVIHTHNVYTNVFACTKGGLDDLKKIIKIDFLYIPYVNPGFFLAQSVCEQISKTVNLPSVIVLENHGIIVHHDNPNRAMELINLINQRTWQYLKNCSLKPFKVYDGELLYNEHLFPDSVVYENVDISRLSEKKHGAYKEIMSASKYILDTIRFLGHRPQFLSQKDVLYIQNMDKEKMRKNMMTSNKSC